MSIMDLASKTIALVLLALVCGAGCEGEEQQEFPMCSYDFEATVRSGPHQGLELQGTLEVLDLSEITKGGIAGVFTPTSAPEQKMYVGGSAIDGVLDLDFMLADGSMVRGTGPISEAPSACTQDVKGSLVGPAPGDIGDWLGEPYLPDLSCVQVCNCYTNINAYCNEYCGIVSIVPFSVCLGVCKSEPIDLRCRCHGFHFTQNGRIAGACEQ